jgi:hypothetical protein
MLWFMFTSLRILQRTSPVFLNSIAIEKYHASLGFSSSFRNSPNFCLASSPSRTQSSRKIRGSWCSIEETRPQIKTNESPPFPFPSGRSWDGRPVADSAVLHPHVDIAQKHWSKLLAPGDTVIDATAGNGHDTLQLVRMISWCGGGSLIAVDIQLSALEASKALLKEASNMTIIEESPMAWLLAPVTPTPPNAGAVVVTWHLGCHCDLIKSLAPRSVKLIVFNLGYLPGGDKSIVTLADTTVSTLKHASEVLESGGCLSVTCYPGHGEGEVEQQAVVDFASALPQQKFSSYWHQWINQRNKRTGKPAPSLVIVQRL